MPALPPIIVVGRDVADRLLDSSGGLRFRHVVSIGAPGDAPPRNLSKFVGRVLRLEFDDIERERVAAGYESATVEDVRNLVAFSRGVIADPRPVLIHCAAGVSRSTATAIVLAAVVLGPGHEREAAQNLRKIVEIGVRGGLRDDDDHPHPNRRVLWLADAELDRGGRLLGAALDEFRPEYGVMPWEP